MTQTKVRDLTQAKMGDMTQAKIGDMIQAKMVDLTEVWLLRMVIHLGPQGSLGLGMGPWGALPCQMTSPPPKRHQRYELRFLFLTSSDI